MPNRTVVSPDPADTGVAVNASVDPATSARRARRRNPTEAITALLPRRRVACPLPAHRDGGRYRAGLDPGTLPGACRAGVSPPGVCYVLSALLLVGVRLGGVDRRGEVRG